VLIWRIHGGNHAGHAKSAPETMGAEKLLELRFSLAARILWHPFNPNRFLLLHRNGGSAAAAAANQKDNGKKRRYRSVATWVDTTRLVTYPHATEGHTVCDCVPSTAAGDDGSARSYEEWTFPGASQFYLTLEQGQGQGQGDQPLAGANDVAWSRKDAKHVLTAHDDGKVRLWDASLPVSMVRTEAGHLVRSGTGATPHSVGGSNHHADNSIVSSIPCVAELDVASAICDLNGHSDRRITRVMFLPRYESEVGQHGGVAITPPFVTGAEMNHTITLWSSFASGPSSTSTNATTAPSTAIHPPRRLCTFRLHSDATPPPLSSLLSVELCPAPYLPPVSTSDEIAVPSSFLLLAERNAGSMHALHFHTEWKADENAGAARTGAAPTAVTVRGFDYVATLNVVHPVFSYCVAPAAAGDATTTSSPTSLAEEIDVELCCVQNKAVQMLTLSGAMVCGGKGMGANYAKDLAEGVSVLEFSEGEKEEGKEEEAHYEDDLMDKEEFEEEEYDLEDDDDARLENNRDGDDEEDEPSPFPLPGFPPPEPNAPPPPPTDDPFSNWLGAIAQTPLPPPTSTPAPSAPPPGLGFPSPPSFPSSSTLPPPPGMGGASAPPAPAAAASTGMTFLSPMEILSGGGAGSGSNPSLSSMHTTTTHHHATKTAESITEEKDAPRSVSASAKKSTRGNASPMGPPPSSTIKGVGANKSKKKGDNAGTKKTGAPAAPVVILKRDENATSSSPVEQTSSKALSAKHAVPSPVTSSHSMGSVVDIGSIESAIETTLASHLKTHEASLLAAMHKAVSSEVELAVRASMKGVEKSTEQSLDRALSLDGKWAKKLEKVAKESAETAAKEAVAGMEVSIVSSLNKTMKEIMIPAYEAATRQMFEQISTSVERGLAQISMNQTSTTAPTMEAMSRQMMQMNESLQKLSTEVAQLRAAGMTTQTNKSPGAPPGMQQPSVVVDVRKEILALFSMQRFEEAFTKAVSASDGDVVLFACKHADTSAVFNGDVSLSQPILICLMQQLGAVLVSASDRDDIKTVLTWLQEIAVTIDPTNENINRHVGSVVQQLLTNINNKMVNCDPVFRRPLQTLMQVIRGLL